MLRSSVGAAERKKSPPAVDVDAIVERVAEVVAQRGGCTIASCKIPKAVKLEVLTRLQARGFEVTKSAIRRPLRDQLRALLAAGAHVPLGSAIKGHVVAATPAEAKKVALALAADGEAHVVARARGEFLVPAGANVIARDRVASTIKALDAAIKLLKKTAKKGSVSTVLREDLDALLEPPATRPTEGTHVVASVVDVAKSLVDAAVGLAFVPAVMRKLAARTSVAAARESILEAARRGEIELRPESGLGRLSHDDLALCIPGIDGTPLSWVRIVDTERR